MSQTEAQKRAKNKYDQKTYKSIACKCKISDYETYQEYAAKQSIDSMSKLLNLCVKYCIDNNIKFEEQRIIIKTK